MLASAAQPTDGTHRRRKLYEKESIARKQQNEIVVEMFEHFGVLVCVLAVSAGVRHWNTHTRMGHN